MVVAAFDQAVEADLVDALRESGDAVISLVAEDDGELVGHIMFSKLQAPDQCIALAPVSVTPSRQIQGIGSRLIREGLARANRDGWQAVFPYERLNGCFWLTTDSPAALPLRLLCP